MLCDADALSSFPVRAAVTMRSRTLEEHSGQDMERTHTYCTRQTARAAMRLPCDCLGVAPSNRRPRPAYPAGTQARGWQSGMTEANQFQGLATKDPWENEASSRLHGASTLGRLRPRMARS